jgi:hypothetical protein
MCDFEFASTEKYWALFFDPNSEDYQLMQKDFEKEKDSVVQYVEIIDLTEEEERVMMDLTKEDENEEEKDIVFCVESNENDDVNECEKTIDV